MLLPGLSGSYLLSILGVYPLVIGAVADFSHALKGLSFDAEAFRVLFSLGLGILCGMAVFSRVVAYALKHYHDATLGLLIGFMLGALRAVWPYWSYAYELLPLKLDKGVQIVPLQAEAPDWTLASTWQGLGIALLACAAVLMIELWAARSRCAADS
jgi:putative membrane protein